MTSIGACQPMTYGSRIRSWAISKQNLPTTATHGDSEDITLVLV